MLPYQLDAKRTQKYESSSFNIINDDDISSQQQDDQEVQRIIPQKNQNNEPLKQNNSNFPHINDMNQHQEKKQIPIQKKQVQQGQIQEESFQKPNFFNEKIQEPIFDTDLKPVSRCQLISIGQISQYQGNVLILSPNSQFISQYGVLDLDNFVYIVMYEGSQVELLGYISDIFGNIGMPFYQVSRHSSMSFDFANLQDRIESQNQENEVFIDRNQRKLVQIQKMLQDKGRDYAYDDKGNLILDDDQDDDDGIDNQSSNLSYLQTQSRSSQKKRKNNNKKNNKRKTNTENSYQNQNKRNFHYNQKQMHYQQQGSNFNFNYQPSAYNNSTPQTQFYSYTAPNNFQQLNCFPAQTIQPI